MGYNPWGHKSPTGLSTCVLVLLLIHFIVQQKLTQHCKATIPQLKSDNKTTSKKKKVRNEISREYKHLYCSNLEFELQ